MNSELRCQGNLSKRFTNSVDLISYIIDNEIQDWWHDDFRVHTGENNEKLCDFLYKHGLCDGSMNQLIKPLFITTTEQMIAHKHTEMFKQANLPVYKTHSESSVSYYCLNDIKSIMTKDQFNWFQLGLTEYQLTDAFTVG